MMLTAVGAALGTSATVAIARAAGRADAGLRARLLTAARSWRLPRRARRRLVRALADAAIDVAPETACELALLGVAAATMLTVAVSPGLLPLSLCGAVAAGPMALWALRTRGDRRFVAALPGGLEHIAAALRGGAGIAEALDVVATNRGPLAADLRRVRARAALGLALSESLAVWPEERPLPAVRGVAGALSVATTMGGRAAEALDGLAASLRERLSALAEARALSSQARLSAIVVGGAPLAYLAFSAIADPSSVDVLIGTAVGRVCLIAGLGCEAFAALWMRAILGHEDAGSGGLDGRRRRSRRAAMATDGGSVTAFGR
jgi:tight adherence protein B